MIDCKNITLKDYPKLTTRNPREVIHEGIVNPQAIFKGEKLYCIADGNFYMMVLQNSLDSLQERKALLEFHKKICIFPDKKRNTTMRQNKHL